MTGAPQALEGLPAGPVRSLRSQLLEIKYKKPMGGGLITSAQGSRCGPALLPRAKNSPGPLKV
jgi:hypothetical protein